VLKRYNVEVSGKSAVVVGRSNIVGKPMALLLLRENATVTIAHSRTADLADVCRRADILCAAVGRAKIITADMVKPGAVVIDFGVNFDQEGNMLGDVDFEAVKEVAGMITPVPGGTGPMTNVMLMRNVLEAARWQVEQV
jgi:methylenetetrahydrofolate dehydrogenase (NADP+)/methenyltetrahydrofolate cyclohydrolase